MTQGQIVAGLMAAAGVALLLLALMREAPFRPAKVKARVWSALVGVRSALVGGAHDGRRPRSAAGAAA